MSRGEGGTLLPLACCHSFLATHLIRGEIREGALVTRPDSNINPEAKQNANSLDTATAIAMGNKHRQRQGGGGGAGGVEERRGKGGTWGEKGERERGRGTRTGTGKEGSVILLREGEEECRKSFTNVLVRPQDTDPVPTRFVLLKTMQLKKRELRLRYFDQTGQHATNINVVASWWGDITPSGGHMNQPEFPR